MVVFTVSTVDSGLKEIRFSVKNAGLHTTQYILLYSTLMLTNKFIISLYTISNMHIYNI